MEERKVLVLYTGGTIGMVKDEADGSMRPKKGFLTDVLETMPEMKEVDMPIVTVKEYEPLIDSSDMDPKDWKMIAQDIEQNYFDYDGFVVLHGTDTMAYTASALSFMLENLGKPVILTGSMISMCYGYSDARRNLLISLQLAADSNIPEVCIFFHDKLFRGNRCKKISTNDLSAFNSPNFRALASIGTNIEYHENIHLSPPKKPFRVHTEMDTGIMSMRLLPGFDDSVFSFLESCTSLKAIIIELYGTGNAPARRKTLLDSLQRIISKGKLVVAVSQCTVGSVNLEAYQVGRRLFEIGVLSAADMTVEAVATKLGYLFGRGLTSKQVANMLTQNLRGEITPHTLAHL